MTRLIDAATAVVSDIEKYAASIMGEQVITAKRKQGHVTENNNNLADVYSVLLGNIPILFFNDYVERQH